jgi:hypothetical protein
MNKELDIIKRLAASKAGLTESVSQPVDSEFEIFGESVDIKDRSFKVVSALKAGDTELKKDYVLHVKDAGDKSTKLDVKNDEGKIIGMLTATRDKINKLVNSGNLKLMKEAITDFEPDYPSHASTGYQYAWIFNTPVQAQNFLDQAKQNFASSLFDGPFTDPGLVGAGNYNNEPIVALASPLDDFDQVSQLDDIADKVHLTPQAQFNSDPNGGPTEGDYGAQAPAAQATDILGTNNPTQAESFNPGVEFKVKAPVTIGSLNLIEGSKIEIHSSVKDGKAVLVFDESGNFTSHDMLSDESLRSMIESSQLELVSEATTPEIQLLPEFKKVLFNGKLFHSQIKKAVVVESAPEPEVVTPSSAPTESVMSSLSSKLKAFGLNILDKDIEVTSEAVNLEVVLDNSMSETVVFNVDRLAESMSKQFNRTVRVVDPSEVIYEGRNALVLNVLLL